MTLNSPQTLGIKNEMEEEKKNSKYTLSLLTAIADILRRTC